MTLTDLLYCYWFMKATAWVYVARLTGTRHVVANVLAERVRARGGRKLVALPLRARVADRILSPKNDRI